jgi:hypothetical protein
MESDEYPGHGYRSNIEEVIASYLKGIGEKVKLGARYFWGGKQRIELDIYLPDRGIAFECNGNYWHSALYMDKDYHKRKTDLCLENWVKLYHLWEGSEEKTLNIIKAKLGLLPKIWARKCKVVRVSHEESRAFFEKNHTHGYSMEFATYGLKHKGELVSALAFRRSGEGVENARFTFDGCTVVGGFTKLLTAFLRDYEGKFKEVISFCDRDLTPDYHDSVYFKNGFEFLGDSGLSLKYWSRKKQPFHEGVFEGNTRYSRQTFQKHKLKDMFPDVYDPSLTEAEILEKKQIYQIWNSGNWKFRKTL